MTRYEFLKSMGFSGAALMALLTSCVKESDKYVEANTIVPDNTSTNSGSSGGSASGSGSTSGGNSNSNISGLVSTDELNKITNIKAKLDLTSSTYSKLSTIGNYVIINGIVVALSKSNTYIAATVTCSHEPKKQVIYDKNNNEWYCTAHAARFSVTGSGLNSKGSRGLAVYKVATDGKTLVVY